MNKDVKYVIMFVCTGNTCRSPMAEGALRVLLEKERPGQFAVISSGTSAADGFPATEHSIEASKLWKSDISSHESQSLTEELIGKADLILAMTPNHYRQLMTINPEAQSKYFLLRNFPDPDPFGAAVDDPIGQPLDYYKNTFLEIAEEAGRILSEIVKRIDETVDAPTK